MAELSAKVRDRVGKGASRALRREQLIPAVIYGDKKDPLSIAIPYKEADKLLHSGGFMNTVITVEVEGQDHKVIPRDYQLDRVRDFLVHVDFLRIGKGSRLNVDVPVHFLNEEESVGLKAGGVLNIVRHTVEVSCPADAIPASIDIDLTKFDVGDSINISEATLPDGVNPTITDRDFTIATIAAPSALRSAEDEEADEAAAAAEAEAAEGEEGATEESED